MDKVTLTIDNKSRKITINGMRPDAEENYIISRVTRYVFIGRPSICVPSAEISALRAAIKGKRKPVSATVDTVPIPQGERAAFSHIYSQTVRSDPLTGEIPEPPA